MLKGSEILESEVYAPIVIGVGLYMIPNRRIRAEPINHEAVFIS